MTDWRGEGVANAAYKATYLVFHPLGMKSYSRTPDIHHHGGRGGVVFVAKLLNRNGVEGGKERERAVGAVGAR